MKKIVLQSHECLASETHSLGVIVLGTAFLVIDSLTPPKPKWYGCYRPRTTLEQFIDKGREVVSQIHLDATDQLKKKEQERKDRESQDILEQIIDKGKEVVNQIHVVAIDQLKKKEQERKDRESQDILEQIIDKGKEFVSQIHSVATDLLKKEEQERRDRESQNKERSDRERKEHE